jgi:hypothetical protein
MSQSRVRFDSVRSLIFYKDEYTAGRRTDPVPQLACQGECKHYTPDIVRCISIGGSGTDVQWECQAELPSHLRLGRVQVGCEGWSEPGDNYILKGTSTSHMASASS